MNRRHCALATLTLTVCLWSAGAWGQARGASGTPARGAASAATAAPARGAAAAVPAAATTRPTTSTAVSAPVTVAAAAYNDPAGQRSVIVNFVTLNVTNLLNDSDTNAQTAARNNLIAATSTSGAPASPAFLLEYGMALNNAFVPKLGPKSNSSVRQRLNIAIVTARVATVAQNVSLQATTILLINDAAEPVMLWGLKAAQPQMPLILSMKAQGGVAPPMLAAITPAVFKHPSGPVFAEAYDALTAVDPLVVNELMKLWGNRLSQYQGKEPPDDPAVDGRPVFALTTAGMWKTVLTNKTLQVKVMQMISDQTAVAAEWADQTPAGDKHDQLVKLMVQCAGGCVVVGTNQNIPALIAAATPPAGVRVETLPVGTKVVPMVSPALISAISTAFPGVQPPPPVGPAATKPAP